MGREKVKITKKTKKEAKRRSQIVSLILGSMVISLALGLFSSFASTKITHLAIPTPSPKTQESAIKAIANPALSKAPEEKKQKLPLGKGETALYTVKENDSLFKIGKMYCDSNRAYLDIAEKNNIFPPYILHTGDVLTVSCPEL